MHSRIKRHVTTPNLSTAVGHNTELSGDMAANLYVKATIRHKRLLALTAGATYSLASSVADLPEGTCDFIITDTACGVFTQDPETPYMVQNGDFAASTGWSGNVGTDWVWTAGKMTHAAGNTTALTQTVDGSWKTGAPFIKTSRVYCVAYTVTGRTAGSVIAKLGTTAGATTSTNTSVIEVTSAQANTLNFVPSTDFDGAVSAAYVFPLSWTLNANEITPISATKVLGCNSTTANIWVARYRLPGFANLG